MLTFFPYKEPFCALMSQGC